jgi:hypothetical protein
MAYNNSKGPRGFGDIKNEDDVDTQIDFESDSIGFKTNNITRFTVNNSALSCSHSLPLSVSKIVGNGGTENYRLSISSSATEHEQGIQFTGSVGFSGSNDAGQLQKVYYYLPITSSTSISASSMVSHTNTFQEIGAGVITGIIGAGHLSISSSLTEQNEGIGFTGSVGFTGSNDAGSLEKVTYKLPIATNTYLEFTEMSAPGNPATNVGRLYSADDGGTTKLFFKDSAGTATDLLAGGSSISQANAGNNRVVTSVDTNNVNAEANLTFDGNTLKAVGYITSSLGVSSLSGSFEEGVAVGGSTIISADKDLTNVRSVTASTNIYAANGYFTGILDVEGNVVLGNAASDVITVSGSLTASQGLSVNVDDYPIVLGAGEDLSIKHDGSVSLIQNKTGHIVVDNTATAKDIRFILGSDDADTEAVKIRNNSGANKWICDAAGNVSGSGTLQTVGNTFLGAALNVSGNADFDGTITCDDSITIDSTTINAAEIGVLDSVTAGTAAASKAMVLDGSKDISGYRNLSGSGTLQVVGNTFVGGTLHVSGALSSSAALGGLTLTVGGAGNRGFDEDAQLSVNAINANSQGISNAGAIAGATTISGSGAVSGFTGTFEGGLTVGGSLVITEDKVLQNVTTNFSALSASGGVAGLTLTVGGAGNRGFDEDGQLSVNSINANSQGISNAGAIAGATTISGSGNASAFTFTAEGGFKVGGTSVITEDKQIRTRQPHVTHHCYNNGSNGERYLPFVKVADANAPGSATEENQMVAPFDGRLLRVIFRPVGGQAGGATRVAVYKNTNTNALLVAGGIVEFQDVTCSGDASTSNVFNFTGSSHYSAGDIVGVSINPHANPGDVNVVCIWEYDMTGL